MSPCLSQSMSFVLAGIGHPMKFRRGDVIYTSPGLFGNLMYVRSGFVVKALLDPVRDEPLLLSMAGPGALCGNYENLYVRDRMPRRHWCLTSTEVLVVNQELLLKIADQNPEWQHELSGYSSVSSICDRMGMFLNYSGTVEERLGALLLLMLHCEKPAAMANLFLQRRGMGGAALLSRQGGRLQGCSAASSRPSATWSGSGSRMMTSAGAAGGSG